MNRMTAISGARESGTPARHKFVMLDALRGVAALSVVVLHYRNLLPEQVRAYAAQKGYLAVDLFFVLSGFVIAYSYDRAIRDGLSFRTFIASRYARLLPMVWAGLAIGLAVGLPIRSEATGLLVLLTVLNAVLIPNLIAPGLGFAPVDQPIWSLMYELAANAIYAALHRVLTTRVLFLILGAALIHLAWWALHHNTLSAGFAARDIPLGISRVSYSFFLGVILCRTFDRWRERVPRMPAWLAPGICVALFCLPVPSPVSSLFDLLFIAILSPAIVMACAANEAPMRNRAVAYWLAALSYPLYAVHMPFRTLAAYLHKQHGSGLATTLAIMVVSVVVSLVLAIFYEPRMRAMLSGLLGARRSSTARRA